MTKSQKLIIAVLALLFIAVLVEIGVLIWPDVSNTLFPPTEVALVMPVSNTEIPSPFIFPTEQPTPTLTLYIRKPTWTSYPTITPWPTSAKLATMTPNPTIVVAIPTPVKPDCSAYYNYYERVHQYYLDYINYTYNLEMSYYQPLLNQALRERDARMIIQIQEEVDQIKAQRDAAIKSENTRYAADIASLNAQCR